MILAFSTQLNGRPTYFVERIHKCFSLKEINMIAGLDPSIHYPNGYNFVAKDKLPSKLHTIREDKNDRWKAGTKIDFFINCRQKNMFRFAPVLPVVSVQKITMSYLWGKVIMITIAGREMHASEKEQFAINDGFDNWDSFFEYFYDVIKNTEDNFFSGKIIHWTNLKY
jgi:hypothetical protein